MENEKFMNIRMCPAGRAALFLLTAVFTFWRPGFLRAETLTMTTYYPAPYGGYASLLTTGKTLLARDGGYVGIGTAVPERPLKVMGLVPSQYHTAAFVASNQYGVAIGGHGSNTSGAIQAFKNDEPDFTPGGSHFKELLINAEGGNVGIGTLSPGINLDVNGTTTIRRDLTVLAAITASGFITSTYSDAKLKKDIVPISGALKAVSGLIPVRFAWKDKFAEERRLSRGTQWGLVAQDVEKVLPELISVDEYGYKRLTYGTQLNMLVLAAIKELNEKSASQQERIEALEAELRALRKK